MTAFSRLGPLASGVRGPGLVSTSLAQSSSSAERLYMVTRGHCVLKRSLAPNHRSPNVVSRRVSVSVVLSLRCGAMSGLRLTAALRLQVVSLPRCPTSKQNYLCNCNCGNLERSAHSSCGTLLEECAGTEKVSENITFFQLYVFGVTLYVLCFTCVCVVFYQYPCIPRIIGSGMRF